MKLLELRKMPKLKYLHLKPYLKRETPLIKALVKNLPNLKINEGPKLEIAVPDPRFLSIDWLWEILCKPTGDFYEPF